MAYKKKDDTDDINRKMEVLYKSGLSLEQVGNEFGMTRQAVRARFMKAGIERRRTVIVNKARLERLYYVKRLSVEKIAIAFGVSKNKLESVLKFYEIEKRPPLKTGGYIIDFLRSLELGIPRIFIWKDENHPQMHTTAKLHGMKISLRKLGKRQYEITRIS